MRYLLLLVIVFLSAFSSAQYNQLEIQNVGHSVNRMVPADIDGDGDMDMVASSHTSQLAWWLENLGDGSFSELQIIGDWLYQIFDIEVSDVDSDGDLDVIVSSNEADDVMWYPNLGEGVWGEPVSILEYNGIIRKIEFVDLDDDGDEDLIAGVASGGENLHWYENVAAEFEYGGYIGTFPGVQELLLFDKDDDNDWDLVGWGTSYEEVKVFTNVNNNANWTSQVLTTIDSGSGFAFADLDDDGDEDLLATSFWENSVYWFENDDWNFGSPQLISDFVLGAGDAQGADIDGDGLMDVLAAGAYVGYVWMRNLGDGEFGPMNVIDYSPSGARHIFFEDMDLDGQTDLLGASYLDQMVFWYERDFTGCTDEAACNFHIWAQIEDGSCYFTPCLNIYDFDDNGYVSTSDLLIILAEFGCTGDSCETDLNGDGIVNVFDLLEFFPWMGQWYP